LGMVLTDRATICQKVSENDAVPERTRARAAWIRHGVQSARASTR